MAAIETKRNYKIWRPSVIGYSTLADQTKRRTGVATLSRAEFITGTLVVIGFC
jgi:hypothetical protein